MATPETDRYLLHLNHALSMESALVDHLEQRAAAVEVPKIKQRIQDHRTQTIHHRDTVQRIIQSLGGQPTAAKANVQSPIASGVMGAVRDAIELEKGDQALAKALADYAVENFEAGVYLALAEIARNLNHGEHVADFDHIRQEEEEMAQFLGNSAAEVVDEAFPPAGRRAA
ncbi:MAG: DUF892 family protein [Terriglobales bacterium]